MNLSDPVRQGVIISALLRAHMIAVLLRVFESL